MRHLEALSRWGGGATERTISDEGCWDELLRHADEGAAGGPPPGGGLRGRRRCTGLRHYFWPTPHRPTVATPPNAAAPPTPARPPLQLQRPRFRDHAMSCFSFHSLISSSSSQGIPCAHQGVTLTHTHHALRPGVPVWGCRCEMNGLQRESWWRF